MNYIGSRANEKIKEINTLKDRKAREEKELFFFEGIHLFEEFIKAGHTPRLIFATEEAYKKYGKILSPYDDVINIVSDAVYEKITAEKSPQGIYCVSKYLSNITQSTPRPGGIILESIRDTGNLGTIIRTAASLGIEEITVSSDCADIYSSKTLRASMGAIFTSKINIVPSVPEAVKHLTASGYNVYAACLYGKTMTLGTFDILPTDSFVLGNEGEGITEETAAICNGRVIIPMSGKTESLNVASASTVIMWEMKRKELVSKGE
ncbi:MAG: TrmH family RNA methyltransferase [Eubacteriales bacterium]|jgi:TrmH family RNA methyltransferase